MVQSRKPEMNFLIIGVEFNLKQLSRKKADSEWIFGSVGLVLRSDRDKKKQVGLAYLVQ